MMKICKATLKDKRKLCFYFRHYRNCSHIQDRVECYLTHNTTLIAVTGNKIMGVLQWHIKEDPSLGVAEIEEVHVLEEYRSKDVGSSLLRYAIDDVKNSYAKMGIRPRKIFIFVGENNKPAIGLYTKSGFKFIAELNDLFGDHSKERYYCLDL
jgi:ribosomal protein S18 acetylase RimI-like enzyme